jgi:hypothetical protein
MAAFGRPPHRAEGRECAMELEHPKATQLEPKRTSNSQGSSENRVGFLLSCQTVMENVPNWMKNSMQSRSTNRAGAAKSFRGRLESQKASEGIVLEPFSEPASLENRKNIVGKGIQKATQKIYGNYMPRGSQNGAKMTEESKELLKCSSFVFLRKSSFYYSKTIVFGDVG